MDNFQQSEPPPAKRSIVDVPRRKLFGARAVVRADLNLPMVDGEITDDARARAVVPTFRYLVGNAARVCVLSHFGRPGGRPDPAHSLAPVAKTLASLLDHPVRFVEDSTPAVALARTSDLAPGEIALLENTRFHPGETGNDHELADGWAGLGEIMVNDAFGAAHRAHASTSGLAHAVRARGGIAVAGMLMTRELLFLAHALHDPIRPFNAFLGGAKIAGKLNLVDRLLGKVDALMIGGAIANTFLAACGHEVGASLVDSERIGLAADFLKRGRDRIELPADCVVTERLVAGAPHRVVRANEVGPRDMIVDIGPETVARFRERVRDSRTVVMNGPFGVLDLPAYARGTAQVLEEIARLCETDGIGILGGGDSAAAARMAGLVERLTHVSTGGGASLALLAGENLPGVDCLNDVLQAAAEPPARVGVGA